MKSNVVPISRAKSTVRRAPARTRSRQMAGARIAGAAARRPSVAIAVAQTPIWFSLFALVAMTMWPSALVWAVQLAYRAVNW